MPLATLTYQLPSEQAALESALIGSEAVDVLDRFERWLHASAAQTEDAVRVDVALDVLRRLRRGEHVAGADHTPTSRTPVEDDGSRPRELDD